MFRSSVFDRCLEKATSQLLLEPDWDSMLQIVDSVRQNDVQPKLAVQAIRKKIAMDNPHVASYALGVLETCVKNCGAPFHQEVATKECMEFLKEQASRPEPVKGKILELIQMWAHAFRNEPSYKAVEDTYHLLKMEGFQFPVLKEADAMFAAEKAPEWKDGETCTRCRVQFGMVQRKHHCRHCGEVFCNKCSAKNSIIPKYGIEREVRVCDSCFEKLNKPGAKKEEGDLPAEYLASPLSKQSQNPPQRTEQEIAEEEELQLALALSRSEAENKEKEYWRKESERERLRKNYGVYGGGNAGGQPPTHSEAPQPAMIPAIDTADMDPELARYLNRNYWQKRSEETTGKMATTAIPSAPNAASSPLSAPGKTVAESGPTNSEQPLQNGDQRELDKAQFLAALQSSLEIFVNRMRSNSQRGRPIANDSSVQSLFTVISNMHPQLLKYQQEMEDSRGYYEGLQDKLTQLRDAREALDSLREEHREKRRCEMEEQERLRQIQMMQKLEVMRQKKHEYLEMQRQLALQRLQEQEREMAMRLEQQKQLTHMRQMQAYGYPQQMYGQQQLGGQQSMMSGGPGMMPPGVGGPGMVQGYGPGPQSTEGSPVHQLGGYGQNVAQQQQQGGLEGPGGAMQGPLPQSQGVYMGPGVAQSAYSQHCIADSTYFTDRVQAQGGFTPQMSSMPGGYQPPPQGQGQLDGGQGQPGYNMPPSSMGYTDPNMPPVGQPSMQYTSMPPTMEYNSFNMQSMAQSLPQQQPPQGGGGGGMYPNQPAAQQPPPGQPPQQQQQQQQQPQQQQQYMGGQYPPSNVSNNQMSGQQPPHHPPPTHQQPHLPHQHPPSHQQHQQSLLDAQLISFD
ncbi:hepatocyte growth factor-regulated tyrosine kinase substrate-like isoform X4 [Littorina saxatilis]|uniref:hepatocyte growth factor-regulated tyrosine kinase substrate-like isoform X4 n=1 Tax=Littorina saxatilis TaxID=31220 RepID=UPI0038B65877